MKAALLALLPAAAVAIGVRLGIERLWIGVCAYHAVCVVVPLLHRRSLRDAGLRDAAGRRWWLATAAASAVLVAAIPLVGRELAWGWMRRASGSLWPCVATHAAADAGIMLLFTVIRLGSW